MFCNLKTDRLGPERMVNKAAAWVKKNTTAVGSVEDCDEVDAPESVMGAHFRRTPVVRRETFLGHYFHSVEEEAAVHHRDLK